MFIRFECFCVASFWRPLAANLHWFSQMLQRCPLLSEKELWQEHKRLEVDCNQNVPTKAVACCCRQQRNCSYLLACKRPSNSSIDVQAAKVTTNAWGRFFHNTVYLLHTKWLGRCNNIQFRLGECLWCEGRFCMAWWYWARGSKNRRVQHRRKYRKSCREKLE